MRVSMRGMETPVSTVLPGTPARSLIAQPEEWTAGWTEDRAKFRFIYNAHRFTLFKRAASPYWYIQFRHERTQRPFSTQTTDHLVAKKRAIARYDQVKSGEWELRKAVAAVQAPAPKWSTIGEVLDRYREGIEFVNTGIRPRSVRESANALVRLLAVALPGTEPRELPAAVLTEETVAEFRARYVALAGEDVVARASRKRGGNAVLRNARAVFSEDARRLYKSLVLPDLTGFRKAKGFDAKKPEVTAIAEEQLGAMAAAAVELRGSEPALYVAHLCYRHLGMRNSEIAAARWGWLERLADGSGRMAIIQRPDYDPKGSLGRVPVPADVMAEFEGFRPGDDEAPLIAAEHQTAREELVYRRHSEWVKPFLPAGAKKTSYELRRWGYSRIRRKYGKDAAEAFVRHADGSTGGKHYWEGFDWAEAARQRGEAPAMAGIGLADIVGG